MQLRSVPFLLFLAGILAGILAPQLSAQQGNNRWDPRFTSLSVEGSVRAVLITEHEIIVGGDFAQVAGIPMRNIARWSRADERWYPMGEGVDGSVRALAQTESGTVIAAGLFGAAGTISSNGIAAWDGTAWRSIGGGVGGGNAAVYALAVEGNTIYAGGNFANAGPTQASNIARWDGSAWHPLGEGLRGMARLFYRWQSTTTGCCWGQIHPSRNRHRNRVGGLGKWWLAGGGDACGGWRPTVRFGTGHCGGRLYVGGLFNNVGVTANSIAQLDLSTGVWEGVGAGLDGTVNTLLPLGDSLIIGGEFSHRGKRDSINLAFFSAGTLATFGGGTRGITYSLAADSTTLCVGGLLTRVGGISVANVGEWSRQTKQWFVPGRGVAGGINFVAVRPPNQVFVTGELQMSKGLSLPYLGMWDGEEWQDIGGLSGTGDAILIEGDDVIVGGAFNIAGGNGNCTGIGRYNLTTKQWTPYATGTPGRGRVSAIIRFHDTLIMAGRFAFGDSILNIAKWDGIRWRPVGSGVTGTVSTMAVLGDRLYVAGSLTAAGGAPASNIAWWDGNSWNRLGTEQANGTSGPIYSMVAMPDGSLVVAGEFTSAGQIFSDNIARWSNGDWTSIAGTNGPIYRLHLNNGKLYVGGAFTRADAASVNNLATYEVASGAWSSFNDGVTGSPGATVRGIATLGNDLFVGGNFPYAGNVQSWNFARFGFVVTDADAPTTGQMLNAQIAPNPSTGNVTLRFTLPAASEVTVRLFTADGKELPDRIRRHCEAGEQALSFRPSAATSQLLFYRIEAGSLRSEGAMMVVRE
ncbi:MAG: transmembrane protein [Chlorobi bacterium OLB7]|nr:MAG: transmembrane protein [Chlorobi bacterium OLB7]